MPLLPFPHDAVLRARLLDAVPLWDRLNRGRPAAATAPPAPGERVEPRWLARWRASYNAAGGHALDARLAWDGLDPCLLEAAAQPLAPLDAGASGLPGWTAWLDRFADDACRLAAAPRAPDGVPSPDDVPHDLPFATAWRPMVRTARQALRHQCPASERVLSPAALATFERHLLEELSRRGEQALWSQFSAFTGQRGSARPGHDQFLAHLQHGGWRDTWLQYPVLARLVALAVADWVDSTAELAVRVETDAAALAAHFGAPTGRIEAVRPGLSDPHHGGRRVARLDFASGLAVAYKPRDIAIEAGWNRLLAWAAAAGLDVAPPAIPVLAREGYGYVAWVEAGEVSSRAEAERYFRQAGSLLAFADLLRAADLHGENVVATAAGPVLVDGEALMQPVGPAEAQDPHASRRSCLATGLLSLRHTDATGRVYEVGGLAPNTPRTASVGRRVWRGVGTDALAFEYETGVTPVTRNVIRLAGAACRPHAFARQIEDGFAATWRFLASHRRDLLAPDGVLASLAPARVRVLFRQSDLYGSLLGLLTNPRYLDDGLDRSVALDVINRVFRHSATQPALWPLVADERQALERHDIPRFTVAAGDHTLVASNGVRVETHFTRSGIDAVRDRLDRADDADLAWQLDQVASVLDSGDDLDSSLGLPATADAPEPPRAFETDLARNAAATPPPAIGGRAVEPHRDRLVAAAARIGSALLTRQGADADGLGRWAGLAGRLDLYDGHAGPALLLAALAAVTGEATWAVAARRAVEPFHRAVRAGGRWADLWPALGAASGLGSSVLSLGWIGSLLGDRSVSNLAAQLFELVTDDDVEGCLDADVERGLAGYLLAALSVPRAAADDGPAARVRRAGGRLLDLGQPHPRGGLGWPALDGRTHAGFAHGAGGVAVALARLDAVATSPGLLDAVRAAWKTERRLFAEHGGQWPYVGPDGSPPVVITGWCHGAPGVALARIATPRAAWDDEVAGEIAAATAVLLSAPPSQMDHVCCGHLARVEALLTVGLAVGDSRAVDEAGVRAAHLADRILQSGAGAARTAGLQTGQFRAGFFQGLSGIAYQLLRVADPTRVPSVLAFEPPGDPR